MAAKKIAFEMEAREAIRIGVSKLARAVKVTLGPAAGTSCWRSPSVRRRSPRTASPSPRRSSSMIPARHRGQDGQGGRQQDSTDAGDGTTTATIYAEALSRKV